MTELDALPFRVEAYDSEDNRELLSASRNVIIARGAFQAPLGERPAQIVRLRNRAHVLEEFIPQAAS